MKDAGRYYPAQQINSPSLEKLPEAGLATFCPFFFPRSLLALA
jgi:hypothetical protein